MPKLSRLSLGVRPCEYRLWPVWRCSFSGISGKPATYMYLIHKGHKPYLWFVQWTKEWRPKWTAAANKSEWFLILRAHFSLSPLVAIQILVLLVAVHHCMHTKNLPFLQSAIFYTCVKTCVQSNEPVGIHFFALFHKNFSRQCQLKTNSPNFCLQKFLAIQYFQHFNISTFLLLLLNFTICSMTVLR